MRLPKKVLINNLPFRVVKDRKISSAEFSYKRMEIKIGMLGNSNREILNGFMHEVAEISAVERGVRSTKDKIQHEANDVVFMASHKDFGDVISDISGIIGNMMKLE